MKPLRTCVDCDTSLARKGKSVRCVPCANRARALPPRPPLNCMDCGKEIRNSPARKTMRCRGCCGRAIATSPAQREAARAAALTRWANPSIRRSLISAMQAAAQTPEMQAHHRALGKANAEKVRVYVVTPKGSASRQKAGRTNSERRSSWCPVEYRALYRRLMNSYGYRAAQARDIVVDQIAKDRAAAAGQRQSFDDQLAAVRAGAKVVAKFVAPRPEPTFTLAGSVGEIIG